MRKKIIAGNWKMNNTPIEATKLTRLLLDKVDTDEVDVVFCVPSVDLFPVLDIVKDSKILVGAQNMHFEDSGAYTGEISAPMLTEIGVKYVIIGHSERREYFGETDADVNKKVLKAIDAKLIPIICVGEKLEQREQGITMELVRMQTKIALSGVADVDAAETVIAYEPIWAIGTGKTATTQQAQDVCAEIRKVVSEIYNDKVAQAIRIQYGGSVSGANAAELFAMPDIDGGLVGGASLKPDFEQIVNYK